MYNLKTRILQGFVLRIAIKMEKTSIFQKLPKSICPDLIENPEHNIENVIKNMLRNPSTDLNADFKNATFYLDKIKNLKKRKLHKRNRYLTRNKRKDLNVLKLNKDGWKHSELNGMREMWKEYMRDNLERVERAPNCTEGDWNSFSVILGKTELIGAEIKVVRSKIANLIDKNGTVVLETKQTFHIVTENNQLKVLLKEPSVFEIVLDGFKFTIFGRHLRTRPIERSVKKIRTFMQLDL